MFAISSGRPTRGMACVVYALLISSSATPVGLPITVLTPPGWIEFTRMPKRPSSIAAVFVMPRIANFDAVYDTSPFLEPMPSIDEMLTIDPPPAAFIGAIAARMPRKHPTWFTLMTAM